MSENFNITGFFYELNEYKFRKFLNIKKKGLMLNIPDLMVVMMNLGKSRPQDGIDNNNVESEAIPDNTQRKIIQLMMNCGIEFSRIINLSDVRETSSEKLYQLIPLLEKEDIPIRFLTKEEN